MLTLLRKLFVKKNTDEMTYRRNTGVLCSSFGIFLNILLFIGKYIAGVISSSIAITADAFNNLSDAGSSLLSLLGFKFAGMKPDTKHPFGHGRIEYLSGLGISVAIIVVGVELAISSIKKIITPEAIDTSLIAIIILLVSILIKLYMFIYNRSISKEINSTGMKATSIDSLADSIATTVVLISALITKFTGLNIDGWCGILVALFILYSGIMSAKDTIAPLLGTPPEKEFVDKIEEITMSHKEAEGIHDLVVHDYGPGRQMISLHVEVNGNGDIYHLHDVIDQIEKELNEELNCEAVIHMDPIDLDNERLSELKVGIIEIVKSIDERLSIHDFRIVPGDTHTNLIFDLVVPFDIKIPDDIILDTIQKKTKEKWKNHFCVIQIDKSYV